MRVQDVYRSGIDFGSENAPNASQRRFLKTKLPRGSSIAMKRIGVFSSRVRKEVEEMNYQQLDKKYTYTFGVFDTTQGNPLTSPETIRLTANLRRGDETRDQFISHGIQPLWIKFQYKILRQYDENDNKTNNLNSRFVIAQWLNDQSSLLLEKVLVKSTDLVAGVSPYLTSFKNPTEMENFVVLADRVKSEGPAKEVLFGWGVTTPIAVGEIYVRGDKMNSIILPKSGSPPAELVPTRGTINLYYVSDEVDDGSTIPSYYVDYVCELCYTDKI